MPLIWSFRPHPPGSSRSPARMPPPSPPPDRPGRSCCPDASPDQLAHGRSFRPGCARCAARRRPRKKELSRAGGDASTRFAARARIVVTRARELFARRPPRGRSRVGDRRAPTTSSSSPAQRSQAVAATGANRDDGRLHRRRARRSRRGAGPRRRVARRPQREPGAGIGTPTFLGFRDGDPVNDEALREKLVRAIRTTRPELLLVHDPATLWKRTGDLVRFGHSDQCAKRDRRRLTRLRHAEPLGRTIPSTAPRTQAVVRVRETWFFDTAQPAHRRRREPCARREAGRAALPREPEPRHAADRERAPARHHAADAGVPAEGFQRLRMY